MLIVVVRKFNAELTAYSSWFTVTLTLYFTESVSRDYANQNLSRRSTTCFVGIYTARKLDGAPIYSALRITKPVDPYRFESMYGCQYEFPINHLDAPPN